MRVLSRLSLALFLASVLVAAGLVAPRSPILTSMGFDEVILTFVVVVLGGLGSLPGAFLASLLIAELKAFCIGLGFSKATLVIEFLVMAVVLVFRPHGLLGRADRATAPRRGGRRRGRGGTGALLALPAGPRPSDLVVGQGRDMAAHDHVGRPQHGHDLLGGDPKLSGQVRYAKLR